MCSYHSYVNTLCHQRWNFLDRFVVCSLFSVNVQYDLIDICVCISAKLPVQLLGNHRATNVFHISHLCFSLVYFFHHMFLFDFFALFLIRNYTVIMAVSVALNM